MTGLFFSTTLFQVFLVIERMQIDTNFKGFYDVVGLVSGDAVRKVGSV